MKKGPKARWTAKEFVQSHGVHGVEVDAAVTIHNLAELGFKYALQEIGGEEYGSMIQIPKERYVAMSPEDKHRECEKEVQAMLRELTRIEERARKSEELKKIISPKVLAGESPVPKVKEKPLKIVDKESAQKIAAEVKKSIFESPEIQPLLPLGELLKIAQDFDLDENWYETAGYLLIEEIALKRWLLQHDHNKQELRFTRYDRLLEMLENDFSARGKHISPREPSRFYGERLFRNKVLHEAYNPTSTETRETKQMAIGLLKFLKRN